MTIMLGPHKLKLQATIDHAGFSMYYDHSAAPIKYCDNKSFYWNDHKITDYEMVDNKKFLMPFVVMHWSITLHYADTYEFWTRK